VWVAFRQHRDTTTRSCLGTSSDYFFFGAWANADAMGFRSTLAVFVFLRSFPAADAALLPVGMGFSLLSPIDDALCPVIAQGKKPVGIRS
jgi:hypothetical protein